MNIVGAAKAKDTILGWAQEGGRVRLTGEGPGRMHWYSTVRPDFYEQLLGELKVPSRANPYKRVWKRRTDRRNEALDCTVYALYLSRALQLHLRKHVTPQRRAPRPARRCSRSRARRHPVSR